jgi:hypothetical protein
VPLAREADLPLSGELPRCEPQLAAGQTPPAMGVIAISGYRSEAIAAIFLTSTHYLLDNSPANEK